MNANKTFMLHKNSKTYYFMIVTLVVATTLGGFLLLNYASLKGVRANERETGALKICKNLVETRTRNGDVFGGINEYKFRVEGQIISVPVGNCSTPITLPAGTAIIDELMESSTYPSGIFPGQLVSVRSIPTDAIIDENLPKKRVTVNIKPGGIQNPTVAEFNQCSQAGTCYNPLNGKCEPCRNGN